MYDIIKVWKVKTGCAKATRFFVAKGEKIWVKR